MRKTVADKPKTASVPWREIRSRVEQARRIVVITHIDPDGDAIGTQLAFGEYLKTLGKQVELVCDSEVPDKYAFLPGAVLPT